MVQLHYYSMNIIYNVIMECLTVYLFGCKLQFNWNSDSFFSVIKPQLNKGSIVFQIIMLISCLVS